MTTALGLFNFARSYRNAAIELTNTGIKATHPDAPITALYYHALELYLKAFLLLQGQALADLKRSFGHNYTELANAASAAGLFLMDEDQDVITILGDGDAWIRARYLETGSLTRPTIEALRRTCDSFDDNIEAALRASGAVVRQPTRSKPLVAMVPLDFDDAVDKLAEGLEE